MLAEAIQKKEDREKMSNGLAEEAEELLWKQKEGTTEPAITPVPAVQTRQQTALNLEQKREEDDEDATASSETIPLDLMQLGDDLFSESQERRRLSRAQKRHRKGTKTIVDLDTHESTAAQLK